MEEPIPMINGSRRATRALHGARTLVCAWAAAAALALAGCAVAPATAPSAAVPQPVDAAPAPVAEAALPASAPAARIVKLEAGPTGSRDDLAPSAWRSRLEPDEASPHSDLWLRVRLGFAMPDIDTDLVRKWEQWYATRPDYVQRMTERGSRYLFHIVEEVQRREMPVELALLPFIESAFNPQAMSSARAAGMWQFMPMTGKDFELKQNLFRDDRRDVLASTRAALDYLQRLYTMFGDWHLALAAYNWGQGNVQRAIERNQRAGLPTDYLSLRMPDETRNYVPKLQAVKNIVARPAEFSLTLPPLDNHPFFLSVQIERDIDVALAARLAGMSLQAFQELNPQMNKPVILAAGTPQVLLPYDNANAFLRQIEAHRGQLASWTAWVAPKTLKPAEAARLVGMPEAQLVEVNRIPPRMLVRAGSTLLVPRSAHAANDVSEHVADNAMIALAPDVPPLRRVSFTVGKKGDSVAAVAKRYRVSVSQVASWNSVDARARFKPGQTVVVMVATKPPRAAASRGTTTADARTERKAGPARASAVRR
jgi:membrane-bound lytic murein transglycosylase D